jgi:hypothetical protein
MTQSGHAPQLAPVLTMLRFFEPPLRLTLRADSFGLATPQMPSFKCAGPSAYRD